jgi:hypothetical protein
MVHNKATKNVYWILLILSSLATVSCKHKNADLAGDAPVKVNDFIAAFAPITLPYTVTDTNINAFVDTISIGHKVLSQFIPDSVLDELIETKTKYSIHPVGRIEKEKEVYLLFNVTQNGQVQEVALVFSKENKFLAAKALLSNDAGEDGYVHSLSINKEPTFTVSKERMNPQTKQVQFTRVGWIYNSGGVFMVVVNDTNEDPKKVGVVLDPIDTLPRKNTLSGDYATNKQNFMSIRDGKDAKTYLFFIHFEKKEGACVGELKGQLKITNETTGIYSQAGDPCIIDFNFEGNEVTLKEKGSCGNRRGMDCYFDDTFIKKKEAKKGKKK